MADQGDKGKQAHLGDELFGTPLGQAVDATDRGQQPAAESDLDAIQADSEAQRLPDQERIFSVSRRVRSKLNNLPDPTKPPLGWVPGRGFDVVFPFINLPDLTPNLNGDWVQFSSPHLEPNRLYYGDNLQVLRTLPSNSIDLIYIDPPFFSGADYNVIWGDTNEVRTFSDIWEGGLDTYLIWLNARLWEMYRVLKSTGSICVHCDWHASHYIKTELDKTPFSYLGFQNEIVWCYSIGGKSKTTFGRKHDVILWYQKGRRTVFNGDDPLVRVAKKPDSHMRVVVEDGVEWQEKTDRKTGKIYRYPLDKVPEDYSTDIEQLNRDDDERIGYPTQKPEQLVLQIIITVPYS